MAAAAALSPSSEKKKAVKVEQHDDEDFGTRKYMPELIKLGVDCNELSKFSAQPRLRGSSHKIHCTDDRKNRSLDKVVNKVESRKQKNDSFENNSENSVAVQTKKWVMLSFEDADPNKFIGLQCKVYWPLDADWYSGHVVGYDSDTGRHHVKYKDGEEENLILSNERVKFFISLFQLQSLKLKFRGKYSEADGIDVNEMVVLAASFDDCQEIEPEDIIWAKLAGSGNASATRDDGSMAAVAGRDEPEVEGVAAPKEATAGGTQYRGKEDKVGESDPEKAGAKAPASKRSRGFDVDELLSQFPSKAPRGTHSVGAAPLSSWTEAAPEARSSSPMIVRIPRPPSLSGERPGGPSPGAEQRGYDKGLFSYGINKQLGVNSLWDSAEPTRAYDRSRGLLSDHDSMRLSTLPSDELERQICGNSGRNVQLAREMRIQNDKLRERVATLEREVEVRLDAFQALEGRALAAEKGRDDVARERDASRARYEKEVRMGRRFRESTAYKGLVSEERRDAVEEFRGSQEYERELDDRAHRAALVVVGRTVRKCRADLRADSRYSAEDFTWLCPQVPEASDDEIGGDGGGDA